MRARAPALLAAAAIALAGCPSGGSPLIRKGFARPRLVAVLPPANHSANLAAAPYVQARIKTLLESRYGLKVLPVAEVEERLRALAVTDGGQLGSTTPQRIGAATGADALVYTEILEFDHVTTGFLNTKKCRARVRVVESATGEALYAHEGRGAESTTAVSAKGAAEAGARALGGKLAETAAAAPLAVQVGDMLDRIFEWFPLER